MEILGLVEVPTWLLGLVLFLVTVYIYLTYPYGHFKKLGIPGPKPYPLVGTMGHVWRDGLVETDKSFVKKYGKIFGVWEGKIPSIWISDLDMIKQILVKRADVFMNRRVVKLSYDPIMTENLLNMSGAHWKHVRSVMTPTFSSGKLRLVAKLIRDAGDILVKKLNICSEEDKEIKVDEMFSCTTMDAIASSAFGVKIDSQNDPKDPFVYNAKQFFDISFSNPLVLAYMCAPFLLPILLKCGFSVPSKAPIKFFSDIIDQIKNERANDTQKHKDFLQLMMNANNEVHDKKSSPENGDNDATDKETERGLTDDELKANALIFFLAGYNTTALVLQFAVYHLAISSEHQEKCIEEVDRVLQGAEPDYDNTQNLQYMDMFLSETMRMYPPGFRLERVASEDVTINGWFFPKDSVMVVPVYAMHHDPEYFPDPEKFDPDRFTPEAKQARNPYTYMPFGMGPRNCIGLRLAQLEMKILLVQILQKFKFVPSEKTQIPLEMEKMKVLIVKGGVWLKVQPRE